MKIPLTIFFYTWVLFEFGVHLWLENPDSKWTEFFFRVYFVTLTFNIMFLMKGGRNDHRPDEP